MPFSSPAHALRARYGTHAGELPELNFHPVIAQLLSHRTVRHFLPDALPAHTLATLPAAQQLP